MLEQPPFVAAKLAELGRVEGEFETIPIRIPFGIASFGVNAYMPGESGRVIEEHDELGAGAGRHEELYFVARGRAVFTLAGTELDAPAGTLVFISDPAVRRGAMASEKDTVVLVAGGVPGRPFEPSPWESWLEAAPHLQAGRPAEAVAVLERALESHPGNGSVLYNLACAEALAGRKDEALAHLEEAVATDPRKGEWAKSDSDFDGIREDPRFPA